MMTPREKTIQDTIKVLQESFSTPELKDAVVVETSKPKLQNLAEFDIRKQGLILSECYVNTAGGISIEYVMDLTNENDE